MTCIECNKGLNRNNLSGYCSQHHKLGSRARSIRSVHNARASQRRYAKNKKLADDIKTKAGCTDCGYRKHPAALDFDHVRGEKIANIASMLVGSWGLVLEEIAKCEVVCANCHRIRTVERRKG